MADAAEKGINQSGHSEPGNVPGKKKGLPEGEGSGVTPRPTGNVDEFDPGSWGLTAHHLDLPFAQATQAIKDNLGALVNMETD